MCYSNELEHTIEASFNQVLAARCTSRQRRGYQCRWPVRSQGPCVYCRFLRERQQCNRMFLEMLLDYIAESAQVSL